jgi:hypothetical protein
VADDFIEEMQREAQLRFGRELSPAECADKFALHNFNARIDHLKNLKSSDAIPNVRDAATRLTFERALKDTHERLRRIDR